MTELAASNTCTKREIANTDRVILELISKVVLALGHRTNKDTDALLWSQLHHVVSWLDDFCIKTECDFATVWRQMLYNGILDDLQKLLLRGDTTDGQAVEKLDHETSKALKGTRYANGGRDFDKDILCGMNIDLQLAGFVDR